MKNEPLRVAMIVGDEREVLRQWDRTDPYFGPAPAALIAGLAGMDGLELHILCCTRQPLTAPEKIAPNIFYHSIRVPRLGYLKTFYIPAILAIRKKLRTIRPQVVHGQGTEREYALAAAYSGYPSVMTIHGNMRAIARAMGSRRLSFHGLTASLENWVLPRIGGVICPSNYTREQVNAYARRTWMVPNAVSDSFFQTTHAPANPPEILCVARICNYKNQNTLIIALDPLAAHQPMRLVFAGGGSDDAYGDEFRRLIATRPWCQHVGQRDTTSLRSLYARASLGVLPTLEDNCPMVILEASAGGLPFAASRIGGIPDLIENGVTGVLFDPFNPSDMCEKIASILADPSLLSSMGAAAKARADRHYRPRVIAAAHMEIYNEISRTV
jgi:glycosyltransferase involved in cell wall biosynthesis